MVSIVYMLTLSLLPNLVAPSIVLTLLTVLIIALGCKIMWRRFFCGVFGNKKKEKMPPKSKSSPLTPTLNRAHHLKAASTQDKKNEDKATMFPQNSKNSKNSRTRSNSAKLNPVKGDHGFHVEQTNGKCWTESTVNEQRNVSRQRKNVDSCTELAHSHPRSQSRSSHQSCPRSTNETLHDQRSNSRLSRANDQIQHQQNHENCNALNKETSGSLTQKELRGMTRKELKTAKIQNFLDSHDHSSLNFPTPNKLQREKTQSMKQDWTYPTVSKETSGSLTQKELQGMTRKELKTATTQNFLDSHDHSSLVPLNSDQPQEKISQCETYNPEEHQKVQSSRLLITVRSKEYPDIDTTKCEHFHQNGNASVADIKEQGEASLAVPEVGNKQAVTGEPRKHVFPTRSSAIQVSMAETSSSLVASTNAVQMHSTTPTRTVTSGTETMRTVAPTTKAGAYTYRASANTSLAGMSGPLAATVAPRKSPHGTACPISPTETENSNILPATSTTGPNNTDLASSTDKLVIETRGTSSPFGATNIATDTSVRKPDIITTPPIIKAAAGNIGSSDYIRENSGASLNHIDTQEQPANDLRRSKQIKVSGTAVDIKVEEPKVEDRSALSLPPQTTATESVQPNSQRQPQQNQSETLNPKMVYLKSHCYCTRNENGAIIYRSVSEKDYEDGTIHSRRSITRCPKEKVILIVGGTGSGKTTWINGLYNYIHGVEWDHVYRMKLIEETSPGQMQNQARSQTKEVTPYNIHHKPWFKVPFSVTIIDTPGLGDTDGIQKDQEIVNKIRRFFTSEGKGRIDHLDAVGFVIQSSLPRLTPMQKYIFGCILSLFGRDVGNNIFLLLTFADGQKPQVISGIKEADLPYSDIFKFNNSALYVNSKDVDDDDIDEMFWKMGTRNYKKFMKTLEKVEPKSLLLTKEVLKERQYLELMMEDIHNNIKMTLRKQEQLQIEKEILRKYEDDINRSRNFKYITKENVILKRKLGKGDFALNCPTCKKTCLWGEHMHHCSVFKHDHCTICPLKCHWQGHKSEQFIYELSEEEITKTFKSLKKKYEDASGKKLTAEQIIEQCKKDLIDFQNESIFLTEKAKNCLQRLDEIALKPNPLSTTDYIDLMIQEEEFLAGPGWKETVRQLRQVKRQAETLKRLQEKGRLDSNDLPSRIGPDGLSVSGRLYLTLSKASD